MPKTSRDGSSRVDQPAFKAGDLLELAGLSYRQLNDWENRAGVFPSERTNADGWRRFTGAEVLALCICTALRRQVTVPLDVLGPLYLWLAGRAPDEASKLRAGIACMDLPVSSAKRSAFDQLLSLRGGEFAEAMQDPANRYAVNEYISKQLDRLATRPAVQAMKMAELGLPVYLCTDFEVSMILHERRLVAWIAERAARGPTVIVPLNATIERFRKAAKLPSVPLDSLHPSLEQEWEKLRARPELSEPEQGIVDILRERPDQDVAVQVRNGGPVSADVSRQIEIGPKVMTAREQREAVLDEVFKGRDAFEVIPRHGKPALLRTRSRRTVASLRGRNPKR